MLSRRGVTVGPLRVDFFPSKQLAVKSLQRAWPRADSARSLLVNPRVSRDVGCLSAGPLWTTPTRPAHSASPGPAAPCVATPRAPPPFSTTRAPPPTTWQLPAPPLTPHRLHPTRPLLIQRLAPGRTWLGPTCVLILRHPPSPSVTIVDSAPSLCPIFMRRGSISAASFSTTPSAPAATPCTIVCVVVRATAAVAAPSSALVPLPPPTRP
jgi:hypothetical protein